ncbi:MAG TPA: hypothetical protein VJ892_04180 [Candidatus Absconditabacterales bacterium]|nr:hypothetical protein [Candidatus Absconditabacterales bacterium]
MAKNGNGFNPLKRDNNSAMTDNFHIKDKNVGNIQFHDTFKFDKNGNVCGKPHTTFQVGNQTKRINH